MALSVELSACPKLALKTTTCGFCWGTLGWSRWRMALTELLFLFILLGRDLQLCAHFPVNLPQRAENDQQGAIFILLYIYFFIFVIKFRTCSLGRTADGCNVTSLWANTKTWPQTVASDYTLDGHQPPFYRALDKLCICFNWLAST